MTEVEYEEALLEERGRADTAAETESKAKKRADDRWERERPGIRDAEKALTEAGSPSKLKVGQLKSLIIGRRAQGQEQQGAADAGACAGGAQGRGARRGGTQAAFVAAAAATDAGEGASPGGG